MSTTYLHKLSDGYQNTLKYMQQGSTMEGHFSGEKPEGTIELILEA
jgi:hypothetical protein